MGDLEFTSHARGYICALVSVICQAFYLTYIQKTGVEDGLTTLEVLQLNNMNCIPILSLYTFYSQETVAALNYQGYTDVSFMVR